MDRPILFSAPMVRALLDGRKTQTRRLLRPQPPDGWPFLGIYGPGLTAVFDGKALDRSDHTVRLPSLGDRLWVREAWRAPDRWDDCQPSQIHGMTPIWYDADPTNDVTPLPWGRPRPGMFMPRWASRLTLTVTDVRVQRLQEISEADAVAEGCRERFEPEHPDTPCWTAVQDFASLWDSLNAKRAPWDSNPWIVAVTFRPELRNIDGGTDA